MYISVHNIHLSWIYFQPHLALAFFFFNHPATTEIYTLSLHDALPISLATRHLERPGGLRCTGPPARPDVPGQLRPRSEEHTSELQSRENLVCRLLLEKKKNIIKHIKISVEIKERKQYVNHYDLDLRTC